jgi:GNAT superfamily N-acetyltransferase
VTGASESWPAGRLGDLVRLCDLALPDEHLSADELEACCFEDGDVLGLDDGSGAVCVWQSAALPAVAAVKLLVVDPAVQGEGRGRQLLEDACGWARAAGATGVALGASAPFYLWPGVDVRATRMLALAESAGFATRGAELNMSCPTTFRSPVPEGFNLDRVLEPGSAHAVVGWCRDLWPHWEAELLRAIEQGSCLAAWAAGGEPVGFACHSVNRAGWFGPTGTDPACRGRGLGAALLGEACRDLMAAGHREVEIAWVGPIAFYAKAAGASVSRVFRGAWRDLR